MYKRSAWESLGGYDETLNYQEDHDFWIRFISEFKVHNVNLPLMYYRQHNDNMSKNLTGRLEARYQVKKKFVNRNLSDEVADQEVLCVVPARTEERFDGPVQANEPLSLRSIGGRPLIECLRLIRRQQQITS